MDNVGMTGEAAGGYAPRVTRKISNPNHPLLVWWRKKKKDKDATAISLAGELGISHSRLSHILSRRHLPSLPLLGKILQLVGNDVSVAALLTPAPAEKRAKGKTARGAGSAWKRMLPKKKRGH